MTDIDKRIDEIMVELKELEYQATHERSHYYVKSVVRKSADIIKHLQGEIDSLKESTLSVKNQNDFLTAQVVERDKRISAYKSLVASQEKITSWYRQQDYSHSEPRLKQLEESLESEREMNAKLTDELEAINKAGE